jgi:hypothetical protein
MGKALRIKHLEIKVEMASLALYPVNPGTGEIRCSGTGFAGPASKFIWGTGAGRNAA